MQTHKNIWKMFQQHTIARIVVKSIVVAIFGLLSLGAMPQTYVPLAQAHACSSSDRIYRVVRGDTLSRLGMRFGVSVAVLRSHNDIANPNLIYVNQMLCISGGNSGNSISTQRIDNSGGSGSSPSVLRGYSNLFPYGSCTWWANQRYYQIHGVFVPWRVNANAWQWTARAYNFGWRVSRQPVAGSILDLQGGVQGASWLGHVAFVEQVLGNNQVIASSMNWGVRPWAVTSWRFTPGPGVTFIY